ncbi:MAG TPA: ABC transporter ATP-binding protein [Candidatus Limnocylindria bacterium]|nr:ABC transporter ATP-binding protein [Candidatus Limnocylindria bacterium]
MARPLTARQSGPSLWRIVRYFWPHLGGQWLLVLASIGALFAEVALQLLEPWPLKFVLDRVLASPKNTSGPPLLSALDPTIILTLLAIGLVAITGLRALASYANTVGFALVGNRVLTEVRSAVFRHLQYLSLSFHSKAKSGELALRVMSDVGVINDVAVTAILPLAASFLVLFGMVGLMLWLRWELAVLALATAPFFWIRTVKLSRLIQDASRKQRQRDGAMAATAVESIGAIKIVQALSLERIFSEAFSSANAKSLRAGVRASRLSASLERSVDLFVAVATALVLWFGARLVLEHALTAGDLIVFLSYLKSAFRPARDFAKYTGRLAKATAAGERVLDVLEMQPEVRDLPGARNAPTFSGALRFEGVSFAYESGHPVLDDVSFDVSPGQWVAVTGASGSGKSTLASLVLRLYDPQQGAVTIDGHDIREYTLDSLRSQISVVLQDPMLFAGSVRDNIGYGAPRAPAGEIEAAALLASAHGFIQTLPNGYDTMLGERGVTLSGGQRQRIALARAAVRRSSILTLDEPTTGLDGENARAVTDGLKAIARGRTTLLISHDLDLVSRSDLILFLDDGKVLEFGTHEELMRADGRYALLSRLRTGAPREPVAMSAAE